MAFQTRHAARTQEWPALPAGRAPLPVGMAPAAERRSVRPLAAASNWVIFIVLLLVAPTGVAGFEAPHLVAGCNSEIFERLRENVENGLAFETSPFVAPIGEDLICLAERIFESKQGSLTLIFSPIQVDARVTHHLLLFEAGSWVVTEVIFNQGVERAEYRRVDCERVRSLRATYVISTNASNRSPGLILEIVAENSGAKYRVR